MKKEIKQTKNEQEQLSGTCKMCGVEIKSIKGKKKKMFCSDRCRWDWWNNFHKKK